MSEKSRKRLTIAGLIFAIICLILLSLKNQVYYPEMPARDAVKSAKAKKNFTYFEGSKKPLVIFYPGALVDRQKRRLRDWRAFAWRGVRGQICRRKETPKEFERRFFDGKLC